MPKLSVKLLLAVVFLASWAVPASSLFAQAGSAADSVSLTVEGVEACTGDTICVAVTATAFDSVTSFQFSLTWEEPILELIELQESFNGLLSFQPTNSDIIVTWLASDLNPNDFDDGDTLLILKMQVLNLSVSGTSVSFGNIAPAEVNLINPSGGAAILLQPPTTDGQINFNDIGASALADTLTCTNTLALLSGMASGQEVLYEWFLQDTLIATSRDTSVGQSGDYTLVATSGNCTDTAQVAVVYDTISPVLPLLEQDTITCLVPSVTLEVDSALAAYDYNWENTSGVLLGMEAITVDTAGSYVLRVTDPLNGCSNLDTVQVVALTSTPIVSIEGDSTINCDNASVELRAAVSQVEGIPMLEWVNDAGMVLSNDTILNVSAEGAYQLTVVDSLTGCTAQAIVNVTVDTLAPTINVEGVATLSCAVDTVALTAQVGMMDATSAAYTWTASDGSVVSDSAQLNVTDTAWYTIAVLDTVSGCSSTEMVQLDANYTQPTGQAGAVGNIDCFIPFSVLVVSGNSPFDVREWTDSTGAVLASTSVTTPGLYFVTLTNTMSGCTRVDSVLVEVDTLSPQVVLLPSADSVISCVNNAVHLEAVDSSVYSFRWLNSFGNLLSNSNTATVFSSGNYTVQVTNTSNGCITDTIITVAADTLSPTLLVNTVDAAINCVDSSFTFSVSSPNPMVTFQWQNAAGDTLSQSDTLAAILPGGYQVVGLDTVNGCTSTLNVNLSSDQVFPDIDIIGDTLLTCSTSTVEIAAATANSTDLAYQWTDQDGVALSDSSTLIVNQEGIYTLSAVDTLSGCESRVEQVVGAVLEPPLASIENGTFDTINCTQQTINLQGGSVEPALKYCWLDSLGNVLADSTLLQVSAGGMYSFYVEDPATGCDTTLQIEVFLDTLSPVFSLVVSDTLDCGNTTAELRIETADSDLNCTWVGIADSCSIEVSAAGLYTAEVTNNSNGCQASETVEVVQLDGLPPFDLMLSGALSCANDSVMLSIDTSLQDVAYSWAASSADSTISTTASAYVMAAGWYTLLLVDTTTACTATDSIFVMADTSLPTATVGVSGAITCLDSLVALTANNLSSNTEVEWLSPNGDTLLNPQADRPGLYTAILRDTTNGCTAQEQVTVQENITLPVIELQFGPDSVFTCENLSVTLDAIIGADESATWTVATSGQLVSNTPSVVLEDPGTYQLTVEQASSGCQSDTLIQIDVDTLAPDIEIQGVDQLDCTGEPVVLTLFSNTPDIICEWMGQSDNCSLSVSVPGTYTAEVTDPSNGCTAMETVEITPVDSVEQVEIFQSANLNCEISEVTLAADSTTSNVLYFWLDSNSDTLAFQSVVNVESPGVYTLLMIDTGTACSARQEAEVLQNDDQPSAELAAAGVLSCEIDTVFLISTGLGPNTVVSWFDETGVPLEDSVVTVGGVYDAILLDTISQCQLSDSVQVLADTISPSLTLSYVSDSLITCAVPSIALQAASQEQVSYNWVDANGNTIGDQNGIEATIAGTYSVTVQDEENGCTSAAMIAVGLDTLAPIATINWDGIFDCVENSATLSAVDEPTYSYQWLGPANTVVSPIASSTEVSATGEYELEVTDNSNGCTAVSSIEVSSLVEQIDYLDFEVLSSGCDAEATTGALRIRGAVGTDADLWYAIEDADFSSEMLYEGLTPGEYNLFAEDAYGCLYDTVFTVEAADGHTVSILPADTTIFLGESLNLALFFDIPSSQIDSVAWEVQGQNSECLSCLQLGVQPFSTTTYNVTTIDVNGCVSTATSIVFVDRTPQIYIPNVFSPNGDGVNDTFAIFPKPGAGITITKVAIYDRWGGMVYDDTAAEGWDGTKSGSALPPGVYVCQIAFRDASGRDYTVNQELLLMR